MRWDIGLARVPYSGMLHSKYQRVRPLNAARHVCSVSGGMRYLFIKCTPILGLLMKAVQCADHFGTHAPRVTAQMQCESHCDRCHQSVPQPADNVPICAMRPMSIRSLPMSLQIWNYNFLQSRGLKTSVSGAWYDQLGAA